MNFNRATFGPIDTDGMLDYIDDLPDQLANAWENAHQAKVPSDLMDGVQQIVICGMGGSSISGELLSTLLAPTSQVPIVVNRSYGLPGYARGPETLVIALSHSGTTEETLSGVREGIEQGTKLLAITTGGDLASLVKDAGGAAITYEYPSSPRAAVGMLYGSLLGAAARIGLSDDLSADVAEAVDLLKRGQEALGADSPPETNPAKRTAGQLYGRLPFFWAGGLLEPVARRWKTQINENAKCAAVFDAMPELNHNSVVGLEFPGDILLHSAIVQLVSRQYDHPRVVVRHEASYELILQAGIMADRVTARGESRLAQQFSMIQFGDYLSFYLAMAYEVDPTPIANIVQLKKRLAEVS